MSCETHHMGASCTSMHTQWRSSVWCTRGVCSVLWCVFLTERPQLLITYSVVVARKSCQQLCNAPHIWDVVLSLLLLFLGWRQGTKHVLPRQQCHLGVHYLASVIQLLPVAAHRLDVGIAARRQQRDGLSRCANLGAVGCCFKLTAEMVKQTCNPWLCGERYITEAARQARARAHKTCRTALSPAGPLSTPGAPPQHPCRQAHRRRRNMRFACIESLTLMAIVRAPCRALMCRAAVVCPA